MTTGSDARREQLLALLAETGPGPPLVERVCEIAPALLGVWGAGICLVGPRPDRIAVWATPAGARSLTDLQLTLGQGPCLRAVRTGSPVLVPDLAAQTAEWPSYADRALARGVRAVFALPVTSGDTTLGSLDLYRETPGPLSMAQLIDALLLSRITAQATAAEWVEECLGGPGSALHRLAHGSSLDVDPGSVASTAGTAGTTGPDGHGTRMPRAR